MFSYYSILKVIDTIGFVAMKPCKILFIHSFDEIIKQSFFVRGWDYFKPGKIQSLRRTTSFQQNRGVPVKKAYFCPVIIISRLLMIQSMTGFGKASGELPGKKIHVEIKSLNSKQLDLNLRLPQIYREKELEMRNRIADRLQRGKVEVNIQLESEVADRIPQINEAVFERYHQQLSGMAQKLNLGQQSDFLRAILGLPEVLKTEQAELAEAEWLALEKTLDAALIAIIDFRNQEGSALQKDILQRVETIAGLSLEVQSYEKQRLERIKERIRENLDDLKLKNVDENRFEQELIYYLEKLDITEEKVRLKNHIDYFKECISEEGPVGKKLAFITQELGREINTMGSKANDADIQRLVIRMKDELEKIKEQMLNVL